VPHRKITGNPVYSDIFGDEFHTGRNYLNLRPNGSGDWLLIYTDGGRGKIVIGKEERSASKGDIVLYGPNGAQDYSTHPEADRWSTLWVHFRPRPHWHAWLQWPAVAPDVFWHFIQEGPAREGLVDALRRSHQAGRHSDRFLQEIALTALQEALLWVASTLEASGPLDSRIRQAVAILSTEFKAPFHLPELARRCGLSVSRFSHLFQEQVGQTPQSFCEQKRLNHAAQLLRFTMLPVQEIARECGYENAFYFSNRFKRTLGGSPSQFRARQQREK
jgi:AraC family transcriptional regulator of arabinose operon